MKEKLEMIGKVVLVPFGAFKFECTVVDYKSAYGRDRWVVTPVKGTGEAVVENIYPKPLILKKNVRKNEVE